MKYREIFKGNGLRAQLSRGGVGSISIKALSTLTGLLLAIALARVLGIEQFGIYAFCFSLISLLATPAQLGLPNLVTRETAKADASGDWSMMRGIWRWSSGVAGLLSALLAAVGIACVFLFRESIPQAYGTTILWGLLLVPLVALGNLRGAALRGLRKVTLGLLPEFVLRPGLLLLFIFAVPLALGLQDLQAGDAMKLHVGAAFIAFAIGAVLLIYHRPSEMSLHPSPTYHSSAWARSAIPLAFLAGMQLVNQNVAIITLGALSTAEEAGIYRVVIQGGGLIAFGLQAVNMVVAPYFARLHASGDLQRMQKLATVSARISLALAAPPALIFIFAGGPILSLVFGAGFANGHTALAILAIGQLANAAFGSVASLLNMSGYEKDSARGLAIAALSNVILNLALVPFYGTIGAAIASSASLLIWNILLWKAVSRNLQIKCTAF